jgi:putative membrane protein
MNLPTDMWFAWTFEPVVVVLLLIPAAAFTLGGLRMHAHARRWPARFSTSAVAFASGWIVLAVSLLSPLHEWSEKLFSAHMVQHELMMVVAAPLLVAARPLVPVLWSLPESARFSIGRLVQSRSFSNAWSFVSRPLVAWVLHAVAIWGWHVPPFFDLAVRNEFAHTVQHVSFLLTALLFWWTALPRGQSDRNASSLFSLFGTALHTSVLGALLTFSDASWYHSYQTTAVPGQLSPLDDQQLGGLIMWIPGGLTYLIVALLMAARLLREPSGAWGAASSADSVPA